MTEDQRPAWERALAAHRKQQRRERWRRKQGLATVTGPGMVRRLPPQPDDDSDGARHD